MRGIEGASRGEDDDLVAFLDTRYEQIEGEIPGVLVFDLTHPR
jgi:hypothetical protein